MDDKGGVNCSVLSFNEEFYVKLKQYLCSAIEKETLACSQGREVHVAPAE